MGFAYSAGTPTSLHLEYEEIYEQSMEQEPSLEAVEAEPAPTINDDSIVELIGNAVEQAAGRFKEVVASLLADVTEMNEPRDLMELESRLHQEVARECLDSLTGAVIQACHELAEVKERASVLTACRPSLRLQKSNQPVQITLLGGTKVEIITSYYLHRPKRGRGRPRKKEGRRKANNNGLYPYLKVLGLHLRASPALVSEVGRLVALGTIELTRDTLERRGIKLDRKVISRIAKSLAQSGLSYRDWVEDQTRNGARGQMAKDKRLGIAYDGGRVRVRYSKKKGRKRKSGRRGFDGEWKEPKVLVVYELDEKGRKKRKGLLRYDASMLKVDGFFELLTSVLRELGADQAKEWVILGDGADWIWGRVPELVQALGFDETKVTQVVDFYHATERLHEISVEFRGWSKSEQKSWVARMKRFLRQDRIDEVIEQRLLFKGRGAKKRRKLFNYFVEHAHRMRYGTFRKTGCPLGSGAVESCVRRVVNLRLKGNGIFWNMETVEQVLHMRAQLLCGRWDEFVQTILRPSEVWRFDGSDGYEVNKEKASGPANGGNGQNKRMNTEETLKPHEG